MKHEHKDLASAWRKPSICIPGTKDRDTLHGRGNVWLILWEIKQKRHIIQVDEAAALLNGSVKLNTMYSANVCQGPRKNMKTQWWDRATAEPFIIIWWAVLINPKRRKSDSSQNNINHHVVTIMFRIKLCFLLKILLLGCCSPPAILLQGTSCIGRSMVDSFESVEPCGLNVQSLPSCYADETLLLINGRDWSEAWGGH